MSNQLVIKNMTNEQLIRFMVNSWQCSDVNYLLFLVDEILRLRAELDNKEELIAAFQEENYGE